jgi:sugar (pentulose or hexulose) kinase
MTEGLLMGIDIGTQSTRAALLDLDGHVIAGSSMSQEMQTPRPGWAEQDPQTWWNWRHWWGWIPKGCRRFVPPGK